MSPPILPRGRFGVLLVAALLDIVGGYALSRSPPPLTLHPLAPPLTRIAALGDHPVAPPGPASAHGSLALGVHRVIPRIGTPEQRARLAGLVPAHPATDPAALRIAVEADALAIATVLGDARVAAIIAQKEALAARYGEGRAWEQARERLTP